MIEGVALTAESAAVRRGDDAHARGRELQYFRHRAMHVMRRLRRGPQRQLSIGRPQRDRRVLLHRQMRAAFEKEQVLAYDVAFRDSRVGISELEVYELVQVAAIAVIVDARVGMGDGFLGSRDGLQWLGAELDQI